MSKQANLINSSLVNAKEVAEILQTSRQNIQLLMLKKYLIPVSTPESLFMFNLTDVMNYKNSKKK